MGGTAGDVGEGDTFSKMHILTPGEHGPPSLKLIVDLGAQVAAAPVVQLPVPSPAEERPLKLYSVPGRE